MQKPAWLLIAFVTNSRLNLSTISACFAMRVTVVGEKTFLSTLYLFFVVFASRIDCGIHSNKTEKKESKSGLRLPSLNWRLFLFTGGVSSSTLMCLWNFPSYAIDAPHDVPFALVLFVCNLQLQSGHVFLIYCLILNCFCGHLVAVPSPSPLSLSALLLFIFMCAWNTLLCC